MKSIGRLLIERASQTRATAINRGGSGREDMLIMVGYFNRLG